jgi:hypothetical protein
MYGGIPGSTQGGYSVQQTTDNGYIIAGGVYQKIYLVKTDSAGSTDCEKANVPTLSGIPATLVGTPATTVVSYSLISTPLITVDSGCVETVICTSVGSKEIYDDEYIVSLFPNPATDELRIENADLSAEQAGLKIERVEIYNVLGEKCLPRPSPKERGAKRES